MKLTRPTIKDIARESGYSNMTVSFALRNHWKVKESTRKKIHEIAERLGYRPDPEMVKLMNRVRRNPEMERSETFFYINGFPEREDMKKDLFSNAVLKGARERLGKHGYNLEEFWLGEFDFARDAITKELKSREVDAVLIPPMPHKAPKLDLDWNIFTAVSIDERMEQPGLHKVHPHHYNNMLKLLSVLNEQGFSRIGICSSPDILGRDKYAWFAAHHAYAHYMQTKCPYIPPLADSTQSAKLKKWYREYNPDCIVVTSSWLWGLIKGVLNVDVPEQLSLAGLTTEFDAVAGIDQNPSLVGSASADMLMAHALRGERGIPPYPKTMLIDGQWKDGPTIKALAR